MFIKGGDKWEEKTNVSKGSAQNIRHTKGIYGQIQENEQLSKCLQEAKVKAQISLLAL